MSNPEREQFNPEPTGEQYEKKEKAPKVIDIYGKYEKIFQDIEKKKQEAMEWRNKGNEIEREKKEQEVTKLRNLIHLAKKSRQEEGREQFGYSASEKVIKEKIGEILNLQNKGNKLWEAIPDVFSDASNFDELYKIINDVGGQVHSSGERISPEETIKKIKGCRGEFFHKMDEGLKEEVLRFFTRSGGLKDKVRELIEQEIMKKTVDSAEISETGKGTEGAEETKDVDSTIPEVKQEQKIDERAFAEIQDEQGKREKGIRKIAEENRIKIAKSLNRFLSRWVDPLIFAPKETALLGLEGVKKVAIEGVKDLAVLGVTVGVVVEEPVRQAYGYLQKRGAEKEISQLPEKTQKELEKIEKKLGEIKVKILFKEKASKAESNQYIKQKLEREIEKLRGQETEMEDGKKSLTGPERLEAITNEASKRYLAGLGKIHKKGKMMQLMNKIGGFLGERA
ncbi:MAG: hypothetical protein KYQ20_00015 [Candidatus Nealsonbacteria bacterium]|nr:hypothetical protein [Candidatus Nealsonbacteria bacterium]